RILGIVNSDDFQIIYSDTPGIIKASYQLQEHMMSFVSSTLVDSDVVLLVIDMKDPYSEDSTIDRLKNSQSPVVVVLNKVDLVTPEELEQHTKFWQELINPTRIIPVSALKQMNINTVFDTI